MINIELFGNEMTRKIRQIKKGKPMFMAMSTVLAEMGRRIFVDGQDVKGSTFQYDTKRELWVSDKRSPKNGSHVGKTGNTIKTTYYKNYKEFKARQGRKNNKVNFILFGNLQKNFLNSITRPRAKKLKPYKYVTSLRDENLKKVKGLEKKYSTDIFEVSKKEQKLMEEIMTKEIMNILL